MARLRKPEANYTIVTNELLRDKRLSLKAKGLYALLFSKPDDWEYHEGPLIEESADGKESFRSGIRELVEAGWLVKRQPRNEDGTLGPLEWWLSVDGTTVAGKPVDGQPAPTKTEITKTDEVIPPTPKGEPDGFEEVWKAKWSRGTAPNPRQPALKAYAAALKRGAKAEDILAGVKARIGVEKVDSPYAPQLATWLNQDRWKDGNGQAVMSASDMEDAKRRFEESEKAHKEMMQRLTEERRKSLGLTS